MTREEAIIILGNISIDGKDKCYSIAEYQEAKTMAIEALEQEPKTGHWIPVEYPSGVEAFGVKVMTAVALKCSECGEEVDISDGDFKLCPNCGARMKEGDA